MAYMNTDIPELGGFDTGVVLDNLSLIFARQAPWLEASAIQLSELAQAILQDAQDDTDTLQSILLSLKGAVDQEPLLTPDRQYVYGMERSLGTYQKLLLLHFLFLQSNYPLPTESKRQISPTAQGRIAYMNSALANKAYLHFSRFVEGCKAFEFRSFSDACEEVQGGLCEYCILPLHTSADGQLMSFYRLIIKYGLQIVAVYEIPHKSGGQTVTTTFGLLRRATDGWDLQDILTNPFLYHAPNTPLTLSVLYTPDTPNTFGDILTASDICATPLTCAGTLPYEDVATLLYGHPQEDNAAVNTFILSFHMGNWQAFTERTETGETMPQAMLMHLLLSGAEHMLLGFYPVLS